MKMPDWCKIITDDEGNKFILPGQCHGCLNVHSDDPVELRRLLEINCYCPYRPPRYTKGDKQKIKRLEWRIEQLQRRIKFIHDNAERRGNFLDRDG